MVELSTDSTVVPATSAPSPDETFTVIPGYIPVVSAIVIVLDDISKVVDTFS